MTKKEAVAVMRVVAIFIVVIIALVVMPPLLSAPSNLSVLMGFGVFVSSTIAVGVVGFGRADKLFEEAYNMIRDAFFT